MAHGVRMPWRLKTMTFSRERDELGAPAARAQPPKLASSTRTSVAASVMTVPEPVGIGPLIVRLDCQLSGDRRNPRTAARCSRPHLLQKCRRRPRLRRGGRLGAGVPARRGVPVAARAREAPPRPGTTAPTTRGTRRYCVLRRWRIAVLSARVIDGRP